MTMPDDPPSAAALPLLALACGWPWRGPLNANTFTRREPWDH